MRGFWFVILLLMVACGSPNSTRQKLPSGQIIAIGDPNQSLNSPDTVRFGHLFEGETAQLPLLLHNQTDRPIVLLRIERSCGCTTLDFENQPIMPDEKRAATISFDARGTWGWQMKVLTIHFSGDLPPRKLFVEAEVE